MDPIPEEQGGNVYVANGSYVKLKDIGAAYSLNQLQPSETEQTDTAEEKQEPEKQPEEETNNSEKKRRRSEKGRRKGR
jgi:hypothetical protein